MPTFVKDPDARLDYRFDWAPLTNGRQHAKSDWLEADETITTASVTADAGLTADDVSYDDGKTVVAWLTGGVVGRSYNVRCHITTSKGRSDDRSVAVFVVER